MQIEIGELRVVTVGVVIDMFPMFIVPPHQAVVMGQGVAVSAPLEKIAVRQSLELDPAFGNGDPHGARIIYAHHRFSFLEVTTEHGKGVVMTGILDSLQIFVVE
jgi:hypothetical protein